MSWDADRQQRLGGERATFLEDRGQVRVLDVFAREHENLSFLRFLRAATVFAPFGVGCTFRCCPRSADAFQQHGGRFVVWVLRYQLAAEGLGEQRGCQALDLGAGGGVAGFEAVRIGEQDFDAVDDFGLFTERRYQCMRAQYRLLVDLWHITCCSSCVLPEVASHWFTQKHVVKERRKDACIRTAFHHQIWIDEAVRRTIVDRADSHILMVLAR